MTIYDEARAAADTGAHAYPPVEMPEPMPMHKQVAMLGKEVAELRDIVHHLRAVIARELGA